MADFFSNNIIGVFFFYGLAFYSMGLAVLLEISHSTELDFADALKPLAFFGLIHGTHEWFEMGLLIQTHMTGKVEADWVYYLRLALLGASFMMLIAFGGRLILGPGHKRLYYSMLAVVAALWAFGLVLILDTPVPTRAQLISADVYTRYALAIPGAALTAWGLVLQGREFTRSGMKRFGIDLFIAAAAFALYGGIGQLFVSPSALFPSTYLNSEAFLRWLGFPIQGFRALMAIISAIFITHSLRAFDIENRQRIKQLSDAQVAEQKRVQAMRAELLHRTVDAQEKERQRIARELHDETGQTLTALGLGLSGLVQTIPGNPQRAVEQAHQLQKVASDGITDLQRMVSGLHPPQLDELGLVPALRWYAQEIQKYNPLKIEISGSFKDDSVEAETRLAIFRIVQEAITNVLRHAQASQVYIQFEASNGNAKVLVQDNGRGFDVDAVLAGYEFNCLGVLGMIERANLIGGNCQVLSTPGQGTTVEVIFQYAENSQTQD